jgi:23S rRNA pseudouridine1911/1915/1917 synthase
MVYIVEKEKAKKRLDIFLAEKENKYTRSYIKTLIESGKITVNGKSEKAGYSLKKNDEIFVEEIEPVKLEVKPENISLDIIYEDSDIIVVNKPKGMVVHPGNGNYNGTLVNALIYSHGNSLSQINGVIRPGIVHRIDKDTTGILVVAKNDNAHKRLYEQFKVHSIKREYVALVKGIITEDTLDIDLPIGRNLKDRKKMAVTQKNSRNAVTHITVLERLYNSNVTYVKARLETGRTHQIRVHMAYIGHPLIGDTTYSKSNSKIKVEGQVLHAMTLGFIHPTTNKYMEFHQDVPEDFNKLLETLRKKETK